MVLDVSTLTLYPPYISNFQVSVVLADITIDLSTAEQDPSTGQFCVVQKVTMMFPLFDGDDDGF